MVSLSSRRGEIGLQLSMVEHLYLPFRAKTSYKTSWRRADHKIW